MYLAHGGKSKDCSSSPRPDELGLLEAERNGGRGETVSANVPRDFCGSLRGRFAIFWRAPRKRRFYQWLGFNSWLWSWPASSLDIGSSAACSRTKRSQTPSAAILTTHILLGVKQHRRLRSRNDITVMYLGLQKQMESKKSGRRTDLNWRNIIPIR